MKVLIKHERMFSAYIDALRRCSSWENGNVMAEVLPNIATLTADQIDQLVKSYNETAKLHGSWGFNGLKPRFYGPGLTSHLNRLSSRQFKLSGDSLIETAP